MAPVIPLEPRSEVNMWAARHKRLVSG